VEPVGVYDGEIRNPISRDWARVTAVAEMHPDSKGPKGEVLEVVTGPMLQSGKSGTHEMIKRIAHQSAMKRRMRVLLHEANPTPLSTAETVFATVQALPPTVPRAKVSCSSIMANKFVKVSRPMVLHPLEER
jgi:hypothetical protein